MVNNLYKNIINQLTSYFQDVANTNNLIVRYDNDPRTTPVSGLWCRCNIDFSNTEQKEIGINSYRATGNFIIEIYYSIKIGISSILRQIDILVVYFTNEIINEFIKFKVPKVVKIGRVEDNYQINIICPFFVDET